MDGREILIFSLGHVVGFPDSHDDSVPDIPLASKVWNEFETTEHERSALVFGPGLPGKDYWRVMYYELSLPHLIACCRSLSRKLKDLVLWLWGVSVHCVLPPVVLQNPRGENRGGLTLLMRSFTRSAAIEGSLNSPQIALATS